MGVERLEVGDRREREEEYYISIIMKYMKCGQASSDLSHMVSPSGPVSPISPFSPLLPYSYELCISHEVYQM